MSRVAEEGRGNGNDELLDSRKVREEMSEAIEAFELLRNVAVDGWIRLVADWLDRLDLKLNSTDMGERGRGRERERKVGKW
jgi:hypothetical protein